MTEKQSFIQFMVESKRDVTIFSELKSSWLIIIFSMIAGVVSSLGTGGKKEHLLIYILSSTFGSVITIVGFVIIIKFLGRKSSEVEVLKTQIKTAFLNALDESSINPKPERSVSHHG